MSCSMSSTVTPALVAQPAHELREAVALLRVHAGGRLVEQEQRRLASPARARPRAGAGRRTAGCARRCTRGAAEPDELQQRGGAARAPPSPRAAGRACAAACASSPPLRCWCMPTMHVLLRGHVAEQADVLERARHAELCDAVRRQAGIARTLPSRLLKRTPPRRGRVEPGEDVEERRLAGAVGPDQGDDGALGDREVDVVDRDQAAERCGAAPRPRARCSRAAPSPSVAITAHVPRRLVDLLVDQRLLARRWQQALRSQQHHHHEDDPEDQEALVRHVDAGARGRVEGRADDGQALVVEPGEQPAPRITPQTLPMPPRMTMHRMRIEMLKKKLVGEHGRLVDRVEDAAHAAEERADGVRPELRAHQRDAHGAGRQLVLADGDPGPAQLAVAQPQRHVDREQAEEQDDVVARLEVEDVDDLLRDAAPRWCAGSRARSGRAA